jgi:hypothetical protein
MRELVRAFQVFLRYAYNCSINPITNANPLSSHLNILQNFVDQYSIEMLYEVITGSSPAGFSKKERHCRVMTRRCSHQPNAC